jgi:uncharacterized membrane protein
MKGIESLKFSLLHFLKEQADRLTAKRTFWTQFVSAFVKHQHLPEIILLLGTHTFSLANLAGQVQGEL